LPRDQANDGQVLPISRLAVCGGDPTGGSRAAAVPIWVNGPAPGVSPGKKIRRYQRDGRNAHGQSTGGSRRSIRRWKKFVNKANRRSARQALTRPDPEVTQAAADVIQAKRWQKLADISLAAWVVRQRRRWHDAPPVDSGLLREAERRARQSNRRRT
jgi:hypothetical protein